MKIWATMEHSLSATCSTQKSSQDRSRWVNLKNATILNFRSLSERGFYKICTGFLLLLMILANFFRDCRDFSTNPLYNSYKFLKFSPCAFCETIPASQCNKREGHQCNKLGMLTSDFRIIWKLWRVIFMQNFKWTFTWSWPSWAFTWKWPEGFCKLAQ